MGLYSFEYKKELIDSVNDFTEYVISHTGDKNISLTYFKENLTKKIMKSIDFFLKINKIFISNYESKKFPKLTEEEYNICRDTFQDIHKTYRFIYFFWTDRKNFNFFNDSKASEFKEQTKLLQRTIFMFSLFLEGIYADKTGLTEIILIKLRRINKVETEKINTSVQTIKNEMKEELCELESKSEQEEQEEQEEQTPVLLLFKAKLKSTQVYEICESDYDVLFEILNLQFNNYINGKGGDIRSTKTISIYKFSDDCGESKDEIRVVITILDDYYSFYSYINDLFIDGTFYEYGMEDRFLPFSEKYRNEKIYTLSIVTENDNKQNEIKS